MIHKLSVRKADSLKSIRDAVRNPEVIDFTERIMDQITAHTVQATSVPLLQRVRTPRKIAAMTAVIALSLVVLSGFTYAAVTGKLSLTDQHGNVTMKIKNTYGQAPVNEHASLEEALTEQIKSKLQEGEAAVIVFGEEATKVKQQTGLPVNNTMVTHPYTYSSLQEIPLDLMEQMSVITYPKSQIGKNSLEKIELQRDLYLSMPVSVQTDLWVFGKDDQSGYRYAYQKFSISTPISHVTVTYSDQKTTYQVSMSRNYKNETLFYDDNPSSNHIISIEGQQVYKFMDTNHKLHSINWSAQGQHGKDLYFYDVRSNNASEKELLAFAKAFIKANLKK
jgi:hypothetical protein